MKITRVTVTPATYDVGWAPMSFCFVAVESDEGLVGWGEACDSFGCTYAGIVGAVIEQAFAPLLIGQELTAVDAVADRMRLFTRRRLGDAWIAAQARSAVENALWDLAGKAAGRSVSGLLGRSRDSVEVYASGTFLEELDVAGHVASYRPLLDRGVTKVKARVGPAWERDLDTLAAVMAELPGVEFMVDGSETFTVPTALRIAERLASMGVAWFEEPIPQNERPALETLGTRSPVPIAYGEHLYGREDALDCLRGGHATVLQPDASTSGGISEARRMAEMAVPYGARVVPHNCAGPLALAANLHLAASVPAIRLIEYPMHLVPVWAAFGATDPFAPERIVDGHLPVPDRPGLGVEPDEAALAAHPYRLPGDRVAGTSVGMPDRFVGDR